LVIFRVKEAFDFLVELLSEGSARLVAVQDVYLLYVAATVLLGEESRVNCNMPRLHGEVLTNL